MSARKPRNGKANKDLVRRALNGPHRRHKRFRTQSLLIDNPVEGRVVNVGPEGFAVESPHGLSVGEHYVFKVRLGEKHLRLTGRIQWCRLTSTESDGDSDALPVYKTGVCLIETPASRAWREALRRMTAEPAYLIWHKARPRSTADPSAGIGDEPDASEQAGQLGG